MKTVDAIQLNQLLGILKPKELSLDEIKNLLDLRKETRQICITTDELKIEVTKNYELPLVDGSYQYIGHPKQKEIEEVLKNIDETDHELKAKLKFITYDKFMKMLDGTLTVDSIIFLNEFLVKE
jgi:DNA-binding transcriptional MerR regulator